MFKLSFSIYLILCLKFDKKNTIQRWIDNYRVLPTIIRNRLVLENCERNFSIKDCLYISSQCGVPIVFDTHHYECYKIMHPEETFEEFVQPSTEPTQ